MKNFILDWLQRFTGNEQGALEGTLGQVIFLAAGGLAALIVFLLILSMILRRGKREAAAKANAQFDRLTGVLGRLEKMEMTLNEFKTETLRAQEFTSLEFKYIRSSLEEIKRALSSGSSSGGPGDQGPIGGGPGSGGPGRENWDFSGGGETELDATASESEVASAAGETSSVDRASEGLAGRLRDTRSVFF